ncbi:uracil phosphoribosyltransferase [Fastidiosibacter lacustris]|uniref:uracil phosphoribosyltransferase n=1 Tax=Fastidiosibacter lacustris TaxID=2056695 RepID=UPI001EFCC4C1|nr:uracil phosphoribosyltransferase [Fastidiosibacter lacustris]
MKTHEITHPLVSYKLDLLRNEELSSQSFKAITNELTTLLCYEALSDLPLTKKKTFHIGKGHLVRIPWQNHCRHFAPFCVQV